MLLRQGAIYWVMDCPPLHGTIAAPHAVIVIQPPSKLKDPAAPVLCVAISSSVPRPDASHVPMPNAQQNRPCTTGLTKPCWAVTDWILLVRDRSKLHPYCGHIGGATLRKIVVKATEAIIAGRMPRAHPPDKAPRQTG